MKLGYRVFVGNRPWETLTEKEKQEFHEQSAKKLEETLKEWFSNGKNGLQRL